jgi:hypothetical protein
MVSNNAINVTEGEVINNNVNMGNGQGAFVFSDDKSMRDPSNGKTFAKSVKKYERAKGRAEKILKKYPNDQEAKNAIMFNQRMIDQTAQRQEETKSMLGLENDLMGMQQGMRYGGKVNYKQGGRVNYVTGGPLGGFPLLTNLLPQEQLQRATAQGTRINYGTTPTATANTTATIATNPIMSGFELLGQRRNQVIDQSRATAAQQSISNLNNAMGVTAPTQRQIRQSNPGFSTLGDIAYMTGKTAELIGKARMARQPVTTYNRSDFEVNRPTYNPTADQRTMNDMVRAQTAGINTGNANLDRALASTAYAQGMDKNAQIAEKYRQMQGASDLSVGQTNLNAALMIADRNENNLASKFNAQDAVLTSLGTYGQAIQDMSNTRASNRVNLQAINQMSQMYNISPENLLNIMRNNPAVRKQLEELVQLRSRG